jgi:hypothetical protein
MRASRAAIGTAVVATTAVLLAGCGGGGGGSSAARSKLSSASHSLGDATSLTVTVRLDATPAKLQLVTGQTGNKPKIATPQAKAITGGSIVIEAVAASGKHLSDVHSFSDLGAASLTLNSEGRTLASLRDVSKTLYLQVDLKHLLRLAGHAQEYPKLRRMVAKSPGFVKDVIAGKWVSIKLSTLTSFLKVAEGALEASGSAPPTPSNSQTQQVIKLVRSALSKDVTVDNGSGGSGHLVVTGNIRKIGGDLLHALGSAIPGLVSGLGATGSANTLPDRNVSMDAFVSNGVLSRLSLNLSQFAPAIVRSTPLPLVASFTRNTGSVVAPNAATPVSEAELIQFFGSLSSGLGK